jgi:hypothetical protein
MNRERFPSTCLSVRESFMEGEMDREPVYEKK